MSTGASFDRNPETLSPLGRTSEPASAQPEGPGVLVPAPFYFAAALLLAWPLHLRWPLRLLNGTAADVAGAVLCLAVAVLSGLSVRALWRDGTTLRHDRTARALVTSGPFRISRNPIYLSLAILVVALGLWMRNAWMPLLLPPTLLALHFLVIRREERYLQLRFGERYERYRARVPRWI